MSKGYIDLHAHWVPAIDDGVRSREESLALLRGLASLGFSHCVATPHIRPGMFNNDAAGLRAAFDRLNEDYVAEPGLPERSLGAEHFFEQSVRSRIEGGEGVFYGGKTCLLVEVHPQFFPRELGGFVRALRRKGQRVVLAHPERYSEIWKSSDRLDDLAASGALFQLDVAALVGKYGRKPQAAAERLLEEGFYYAAASDAHRPDDIPGVGKGMERLGQLAGPEEAEFLLREGPSQILSGAISDA